MKSLITSLLLFLCLGIAQAQDLHSLKKDYDPGQDLLKAKPLTNGAFSRSIYNHFGYTILGSPSPATGFKVETDKPSIALKGRIGGKKYASLITTLELQAGADGQFFKIFSDDKLSTYFKATVGFNKLLWRNFANYEYFDMGKGNDYVAAAYRQMAIDKYNELVRQDLRTAVMRKLLDERFIKDPNYHTLLMLLGNKYTSQQNNLKAVLQDLFKNVEISYDSTIPDKDHSILDGALVKFSKLWIDTKSNRKLKEAFLKDYKKEAKLQKRGVDSLYTYEMDNVSEVWTKKFIWWLNGSPFVSNANFMHYQTLTKTLDDKSSVLWGARFSLNLFLKYKSPNRYHYATIGFAPQRMNSLEEMKKYSYKKTTVKPVVKDDNTPTDETEAVAKEEPGTAYEGKYQSGPGLEIFAEVYTLPWSNNFAPGFYFKFNYTTTSHRINTDQIALYAGLMWNVQNSDKDAKNLLTIIPYAGWSNLKDQYRNENKTDKVALHSLFTAGLRIGVPINIGK